MSKGALGLLSAYWPEGTARYAHVPLKRVTQQCVTQTAEAHGERAALVAGGRRLAYAELAERTAVGAARLRERAEPGARVVLVLEDPLELFACTAAALEADLLVWARSDSPAESALAAFEPELAVTRTPLPGPTSVSPDELAAGEAGDTPARPKLRNPVLALPRPGGGEVLHSHRTLVATAIAWSSFFLLEPGAEVGLFEPPHDWLTLAAWWGAWQAGATLHALWDARDVDIPERLDYAVMRFERAAARHLPPGTRPFPGRIGAGALVGLDRRLSASARRRLARRVRAPVLSVFGRNDLGPVLASHPTWYLDDAMGIPLPNVDLRPFDPAQGRELAIGWDAVEEAEMGVKSALAPAGGELAGGWLRTREIAHVDPTGLYFLR